MEWLSPTTAEAESGAGANTPNNSLRKSQGESQLKSKIYDKGVGIVYREYTGWMVWYSFLDKVCYRQFTRTTNELRLNRGRFFAIPKN